MNEGVILGDALAADVQEFTPQLSSVGEEKVVAVYNPLPVPFRVQFARQTPYRPTPDANLQFAREKGLPLEKNSPKSYVTQDVILPAEKITNLPGDIAQVAVRKLVNTLIQTRNDDGSYSFDGRGGHKGMIPDPQKRKDLEAEVIKGIYDATDFFNRNTQPAQVEVPQTTVKEPIDAPDPAPGTGVSYTPKTAVPAGAGQPDTAQSETAK